jgi:hypothetical protein
MDQIHLSPLVDQIQLALGHISNTVHLVQMATPKFTHIRIKLIPFAH